jgi:hypothetical protein
VHRQVGLERFRPALSQCGHREFIAAPVDPLDARADPHVDAHRARPLDKPRDDIRVEAGERAIEHFQHRDRRARGHVSELERDKAAADEEDPRGKPIEIQELFARRQIARSLDWQARRPRTDAMCTRRAYRWSSPTCIVVGLVNRAVPWNVVRPASPRRCSISIATGSVKVRLNRTSAGHTIRSSPSIPLPRRRLAASIVSAAPTSTFLGSHPRSAHVPP